MSNEWPVVYGEVTVWWMGWSVSGQGELGSVWPVWKVVAGGGFTPVRHVQCDCRAQGTAGGGCQGLAHVSAAAGLFLSPFFFILWDHTLCVPSQPAEKFVGQVGNGKRVPPVCPDISINQACH